MFRDIFLTPEGKITRRNAEFIVRAIHWATRNRPIMRDTSYDGIALQLHEALCRQRLAQGVKRKRLIHILKMGERMGLIEVKK